ncbi:two-component system histidine kinase PnpS [Bacillus dakarensis]|uniref:two-component system histidine kinase PnpS n=1 Tax=Robertmurraya dakarensis TaxID=1926278 RepID=UPI000980E512|nr:ATP-binding protein [Bacillus dakarensis]
MTKYRTRLLFGLITLIFTVLIGLALILGQLFKSHYINSFDSRLNKEISLFKILIEDSGGLQHLNKEKLELFSKTMESRATVSDKDGNILYDSGDLDDTAYLRHKEIIEDIVQQKNNTLSSSDRDKVYEVRGGYNLHYYWREIIRDGNIEGYLVLSTKLTEIQKAYQQIWWILSISLGIALMIIILLGIKITARYTKPIESATKVAMELAKGNYRARTYEDHIDETGMLSTSINILARNLQTMVKNQEMQQDRLGTLIENMGSGLILIDSRGYINLVNRTYKEVFNVKQEEYLNRLYYEVIEHKEVTDIIEQIFMTEQRVKKQMHLSLSIERRHFEIYGAPIIGINDVWKGILLVFHDITELKKLEQVRKDFVANVSHELKTPITSIKGFSETLLDGAMEDKNTLEAFLNIILKESDRLQSLIQDLLDLSKIEQQGYSLSIGDINLVQLLQEVLPILKGKAAEKNIELVFETTNQNMELEGDLYRLKQVFINLITNAITYTPNEGKVTISIDEDSSYIITTIKDTGIGISKEELPRIFERFYRIDKARSRNSGGTGLGLAIVKHLVEAHNGQIIVASEVGKGTTFEIKLHKNLPQ